MRFASVTVALVASLVVGLPSPGLAQKDTGRRANEPPAMMRQQRGGGRGQMGMGGPERARLMGQIRRAFTRAVRNQVGLSGEQMRQLAPINRKYVQKRQALARQDRSVRLALREELNSAQPDQAKVAEYTRQLQAFSRQQLDLNDAEERELGGIMTPVQLARFRALQERIQRRLNMMRPLLMGDSARGGRRGPPPAGGRGR